MPRFYFNLHDGKFIPDEEGTELLDFSAARKEASKYVARLLADDPDHAWEYDGFSVEVTDHRGMVIFKLIVMATSGRIRLVEEPMP